MGKKLGKIFDDWRRAKGEVIGGGHFVFRRGKKWNRVRFVLTNGGQIIPFEHATLESALAECERLSKLHQGQKFSVFSQVAQYQVPAQEGSA